MKKAFAAFLILSMLLTAVAVAEAADVTGTWYLVEMREGEQSINPADFGMSITMQLNEDGTAILDSSIETEPQNGTWSVDGETIVVVDGNDQPMNFVLQDGQLVADEDGHGMIFGREEPEGEAFTPAAPVVAAAAEDFFGAWQAAKIGLESSYYDVSMLGAEVSAVIDERGVTLDGFLFSQTTLPLTFADGAMSYAASAGEGEDAMNMSVTAQLLEDGALSLALDGGETGSFTFFLNRVEETAEAAPAE